MGGKVASGSPEQVGAEAIKYVFGPAKKTPTVTYPMSGQWSDDIYRQSPIFSSVTKKLF